MTAPTTQLRVAVVGAGPAGVYVAAALIDQQAEVRVDVYDRLPTPFGLVRYGVAPDHVKMKSLARTLQRTLDDERVRFLGNVRIGVDVSVEELLDDYHAVVYSVGASIDRTLGIPGEELAGSHGAAEFVAWYSAHPDAADAEFELDATDVAVIGLGNVALDVARVLLRSREELAATDVPDRVLEALAGATVTDVHIVGRRGPRDAKFTHKELRELGELDGVDVIVHPLDPSDLSDEPDDPSGRRHNLAIFREWSTRSTSGAPRRLHLHFFARPRALLGQRRVEALQVERRDRSLQEIPAQLVFRSLGSVGVGLPGVPFDSQRGVVPTEGHRVTGGHGEVGEYASGWIKRGSVGVIGTNRSDGTETAAALLADVDRLRTRDLHPGSAERLLRARGVEVVTLSGWADIDRAEIEQGVGRECARVKLATWSDLLGASDARR